MRVLFCLRGHKLTAKTARWHFKRGVKRYYLECRLCQAEIDNGKYRHDEAHREQKKRSARDYKQRKRRARASQAGAGSATGDAAGAAPFRH